MPKVKGGTAVQGTIKEYQMPTGTPEQLRETWEKSQDYLYRILSYAPKDKELTPEQLEEERRYFQFIRLGPRAGYLRHSPKTKLTSADVLYILTCTLPAKKLAPIYGVSEETINGIRRNAFVEWSWEYYFVKRLKTHIRSEILCYGGHGGKEKDSYIRLYKIDRLKEGDTYETVGYASGIRKAQSIRKELCPKKDYERYLKNKTLDIMWPITKIDIL